MRHLVGILVVASVWACGDSPPAGSADGAIGIDATASGPDGSSQETFDCSTVPASVTGPTVIPGPVGHDGLVINAAGQMVGSNDQLLVQSNRNGDDVSAYSGNVGEGHQMDMLPGGVDIVMSTMDTDGALTRITPAGSIQVILSSANAYSVVVGPDEWIWYARNSEQFSSTLIRRVHPTTGESETMISSGTSGTARSIEFSPDGTRLYIGTAGAAGAVHYTDLAADMTPGPIKTLTTGIGDGESWMDAIGVDACGNLYIYDAISTALWRVTPTGDKTKLHSANGFEQYPHAIVWGTGRHGWNAHAIYSPRPYGGNQVVEFVVGAPSRDFGGTVINKPARK